jgi:acyl dehydratase
MSVAAGDSGPPFGVGPITRTDIVRYAGASGDFNPVHHDEPFALSAGLPSVMAHGMLSAGILASFVTRWFGAGAVRRYKVRFRERVWPGDVLGRRPGVRLESAASGGRTGPHPAAPGRPAGGDRNRRGGCIDDSEKD